MLGSVRLCGMGGYGEAETQVQCQMEWKKALSLSLSHESHSSLPNKEHRHADSWSVLPATMYDTRIQDFLSLSVPLHNMLPFHAPIPRVPFP